jgi:hypothetical protein
VQKHGEQFLKQTNVMTSEYEELMDEQGNVYKQQHGGSHYQNMAITPIEYAMKNHLDACQFSVVKYVSRFRDKNGKEDLEKAKDFIDMLIASEYGE